MTEYNKVVYDGQTLIDLTQDDVTASDVRSGVYFHNSAGVRGQGTLTSTSIPTADTIAEWDSSAHMNSTDMTSADVSDFVDDLTYTSQVADVIAHMADYIVDQGTSGIWTYRKWNSGIAECWGTHNETVTNYTTAFGGYAYSVSISFPSSFFTATPRLMFSVSLSTVLGICGVVPTNTLSSSGATLYAVATTSGSKSTDWNIYAIGKWK